MTRPSSGLVIIGLAVGLAGGGLGCNDAEPPFDPGIINTWELRPAIFWEYPPVLVAPDTVFAGIPFEVEVITTIGGCNKRGDMPVKHLGASVTQLSPRDSFYTGNGVCPGDIRAARHAASLTFDQPGEGIILAVGRTYTRSGPDSLVTIGRSVVVK